MELEVEDPLAEFDQAGPDPATAGPMRGDVPAANCMPSARSVPDATWTTPKVFLPGSSSGPVQIGSLTLCGATKGLLAEAVEAFLPPGPEPEVLPYTVAVTNWRWALRAVEWVVAADLAERAAAPAAEAVESFLPPFAEPQIVTWPAVAAALPRLSLAPSDWVVATEMAEPVAAPAAEAVESFLPPFAEPQIVTRPTTLPSLALAPTDWVVAAEMADPVAAPAAEAVESLLPPFAEPQIVTWPAALPGLTLAPTDWVVAADVADPVAAPAAEAVESFLPHPVEPRIVTWPAAAAALPRLSVNPAAWVLSVDLAEPVAAPAAEAVESFLPPPVEPRIVTWPAASAVLPGLSLDATDWAIAATVAEPAAAPAAEAVESFLPPFAEPRIVTWPAVSAMLPGLSLAAIDWTIAATVAEPVAAPAAEAVESFLPPAAEPCALPLNIAVRLPELALIAAELEKVEEFVPPIVVADPCESWMPSPPACEVVSEVIPTFAGALPAWNARIAPAAITFELEQPAIRWVGDWRPSATAEPVLSYVAPHLEPALPATIAVTMPDSGLQRVPGRRVQNLAAPAAERYPEAAGPSSDTPVIAASSGEQSGLVPRFPALNVEHTTGDREAPFQPGAVSTAEPAAAGPNARPAIQRPDIAFTFQDPALPEAAIRCGFLLAKPVGADYVCQRMPMAPIKPLEPAVPGIAVQAPKFVVRPRFERVEEYLEPPKPVERTPTFAEIFVLSKAGRRHTISHNSGLFSAGKLIAASLIVGLGMWIGAGGVKISRQMLAINTSIRGMASNTSSGMDVSPTQPQGFPSPRYSAPQAPEGAIAKVRRAIQRRASVEFTDTFRRMEAWGASAMTLPAGWTRHPDGYVRTGQLALYRPAQTFADYHFEFFGEIEKKSMGWAVRARDKENYYAMKMTVIEPGLRPVIAVVHYPVVGGKRGQRVETPLSMMIHNNEPYHVAVDVKGNRVVTSIEGQEVDSWSDDAIKVGGVGFFSEVGESARLYWMRVSKNQDWLGRVCAYLSSGSGSDTADLWRGDFPQAPAQPSQPLPPPVTDVTLAAAEETEEFSHIGPQGPRILKYGRTQLCRS